MSTRAALDVLAGLSESGAAGALANENGRVTGRFLGAQLASVFQPIVRASDRSVAGYEGLVRVAGTEDAGLSPWNLFSLAADDVQLVALDRLCRTLHALNFAAAISGDRDSDVWLQLNVHQRLLGAVSQDHGRAFLKVLEAVGLARDRVVIELPAAAAEDRSMLKFVAANYRFRGYRLALHFSGAGWNETLAVIRPDRVLVDPARLPAGVDLRAAVAAVHESGSQAIATRLESAAAVDEAQAAGADLLQGFAVRMPDVRISPGVPVLTAEALS